jgi:hypothetical protein
MKSRTPQNTGLASAAAGSALAGDPSWAVEVLPMDPSADWIWAGFEEWLVSVGLGEGDDPGFEPPAELWDAMCPADEGVASESYSSRLDSMLDHIAEDESALAMRSARRARSVEVARVWALTSDEFVLPNARMTETERFGWTMRCFLSEVATRQRLSEAMAAHLVEESRMLVSELPGTLEALEHALISYRHAQVIIEQARTLPLGARAGFEDAVLPEAPRLPVARFRKVAVRAREYLHPDSIAAPTKTAIEERYVQFDPAADGMAWVTAYLPADRAQALFNRVTVIAKSLQSHDGEKRTLPQIRADVASDLLLDGQVFNPHTPEQTPGRQTADGLCPAGHDIDDPVLPLSRRERRMAKRKGPNWGIRPTVIVTVPVMTLLGHSEEPGSLDGYGPIDADSARRLAAQAPSFRRLLVHPETGVALSLGTEHYRVPAELRLWLHLRDGVCRFPGCTNPAIHSEIDHSRAAEFGGPTDAVNLAGLCGPHHRLKHATSWQLANRGDGILNWTSPTGKTYTTYPATTLPHPPPQPGPTSLPRSVPDSLDEPPPF